MDARIQMLTDWGCDVGAGMQLALNNEAFYLECVNDTAEDESYDMLLAALKKNDAKEAFNLAHSLKGVFSNLGLTPMYEKCMELVEPLRDGHCAHLTEKAEELLALRRRLIGILHSA